MKTIKPLLAALALSISGSAMATNIGITMTSFDNPFLTILLNGMKAEAEKERVTLQLEDAKLDIGRQMDQVQSLIANGADVIIINTVDADSTPAMTQIAKDAGVPLVYVNHPPADLGQLPDNATFVGSNEKDSGTLETREVCRLLGGKGKAVVIMGPLSNEASLARTKDVHDVLATEPCKGIQVVEQQAADWSRIKAHDLVTNWLTAGTRFNAVIANNDEMAIGATQALKEVGISMDDVVVGGIDATPDGLNAMKTGDLDVTVFQNATRQGEEAIRQAIKLANGEKVPPAVWVPFELVTPANMDQYMKAE